MTAGCFYQNYREVRLLIIHCSATRYDRDFPVEALRASHKARGFADIGYHFYITRDGYLHRCRPVNQIGAHAAGWNDRSIGICYEGGLDEAGTPSDTRTYAQKCSLLDLLRQLLRHIVILAAGCLCCAENCICDLVDLKGSHAPVPLDDLLNHKEKSLSHTKTA